MLLLLDQYTQTYRYKYVLSVCHNNVSKDCWKHFKSLCTDEIELGEPDVTETESGSSGLQSNGGQCTTKLTNLKKLCFVNTA